MSGYPTVAALKDSLRSVQAESGGLLEVSTMTTAEAPAVLAAAGAGNRRAFMAARAVLQALQSIRRNRHNRKGPPLCACCPRALVGKVAFGFGVAVPAITSPSSAIAFAICDRCAPDKAALEIQAQRALQQFWPDSRPVTPTHGDGGRA